MNETGLHPLGLTPSLLVREGDAEAALLQQQGLKRLRATLLPFSVGMSAAVAAASAGLAEMWQAMALVAYTVTGLITFYLLLRSGTTRRWRDPMLTFPQVMFSIGLIGLSYALMGAARALALEWLCLIIVFDMRRLPKRHLLIAAGLAMGLPSLGIAMAWFWHPEGIKVLDELSLLAIGSLAVPIIVMVSARARKLQARRQEQREQMAEMLEQMRQFAVRDGLTGLYNRRHVTSQLNEEVRRFKRTGRPFSIAMLDIDFFKQVNDRFGHTMGDTVLRHFAALAMAAFQDRTDILARWGGEEFLLLMPETSQAQAHAALMRLRALMHSYDWAQHHPDLKVRFSAGICEHQRGHPPAQMLEEADAALYRAKAAGRDRIEPAMPLSDSALVQSNASEQSMALLIADVPQYLASDKETQAARATEQRVDKNTKPRYTSGLVTLLLGKDVAMQESLRMCLMASVIYAALVLNLSLYAVPHGVVAPDIGLIFIILCAVSASWPVLVVRSGLSARLRDRTLQLPQMLTSCVSLAAAYALIPAGRSFCLQIFCVVMIFGFINLRPRQVETLGGAIVALLAMIFLYLLGTRPPGFDPVREGLQLLASAFIFLLLTLQSRNLAISRAESAQEKRQLSDATEQVRRLMMHDTLTGLFNRQHMQAVLEREVERSERSGQSFCVALIDLDHFKQINDKHGHQVGDEALEGFAKAGQKWVRETDVLGRWGGEEFLLVLPETAPEDHGLIGTERLRQHVAEQRLCASVPDLQVTFSAGVAQHRPGEGISAMLERADQALYLAKAQGRNRCVISEA